MKPFPALGMNRRSLGSGDVYSIDEPGTSGAESPGKRTRETETRTTSGAKRSYGTID
jgi:hypothetical protein